MGLLFNCAVCCSVLSFWGVVQLFMMGVFYYIEAVPLYHDCQVSEYDDIDDFIAKVKENYRSNAVNCWIASALYAMTLAITFVFIRRANRKSKKELEMLESDHYFCTVTQDQSSKLRRATKNNAVDTNEVKDFEAK